MNLVYKKIEEKDKEQLFKLIETVLGGLEDKEYFIPYEQWEYDSMFDEKNYAPLYGAYDGDKLAGMAQLYVSQEMLADFKKEFGLEEYQVCELGGNLVLPEYRGNGITTKLQTIELNLAKELGFDYIISKTEVKYFIFSFNCNFLYLIPHSSNNLLDAILFSESAYLSERKTTSFIPD